MIILASRAKRVARSWIRKNGKILSQFWTATTKKAITRIHGESPVSESCQIPNIRQIYQSLGLNPRRGRFVEIGAFDGESFSNSSFLADQGWYGLYFEPIPEYCALARWRHIFNDVTVEPVAIATETGSASIFMMGALTTMNSDTRSAYERITWATGAAQNARTIDVRTETLTDALHRNALPFDLDLMIIDVEGAEEPIIAQLLNSPWRPRVLIVELNDLHPDFRSHPELQSSATRCRRMILSAGYSEKYADYINTVFKFDPGQSSNSASC